MKYNKIYGILCSIMIAAIVYAREEKSCLYFSVNKDFIITACLAQNMEFAIPENVFMGKNILKVIELNGADQDNIDQAFDETLQKRETTIASYIFDNKKFKAKITPLFNADNEVNFFIKVVEQK